MSLPKREAHGRFKRVALSSVTLCSSSFARLILANRTTPSDLTRGALEKRALHANRKLMLTAHRSTGLLTKQTLPLEAGHKLMELFALNSNVIPEHLRGIVRIPICQETQDLRVFTHRLL